MVVVASEEQGTRQPCVLAAMTRFSNKAILQQVRRGTATFELVAGGEEGQQQQQKEQQKGGGAGTLLSLLLSPFFGSPDTTRQPLPHSLCFAKIGTRGGALPARSTTSQAVKKLEHYTVRRIVGDGRCMFRALVLGMAANKGLRLDDVEETQEADQLRLAVMDALCRSDKRRRLYEEALIAITVEESLKRYCQRIPSSNFWGGESELLVLSRMCSQPIVVYIPESEANEGAKWGTGFIPIAEYGSEFTKPSKDRKGRKPVRLLYNGSNHYDLLI